jgi:hypothetical protein
MQIACVAVAGGVALDDSQARLLLRRNSAQLPGHVHSSHELEDIVKSLLPEKEASRILFSLPKLRHHRPRQGMAFRCTGYGRQPSAILRSEIQYLTCWENYSNLFEAFKASVMLGLQSTHR